MAAIFATTSNQQATLKELYKNPDEFMKDLVYKQNPFLALVPKDESVDGFSGKYMPIPIVSGTPQGRSKAFANAQNQQTATDAESFFVATVQDYQVVSISNLLMEQTKTNAGAFIQAAKLAVDGGFRTLTNNVAFELFSDGTCVRGAIGSATGPSSGIYTITLASIQSIVNFERGMSLQNATISGGSVTINASGAIGVITAVDRGTGVIKVQAATDSSWGTAGNSLGVAGDLVAGTISTSTNLGLTGLAAWIPKVAPAANDLFWNVNRSIDVTRLGGLRYDGSAYTIEEAITNALALMSREGANPDICIINFQSYSVLVNSLGAKVQYVDASHDSVEVSFRGIKFQSSYGIVTVLSDRSCPPNTAYLLTMDTFKLRSMNKIPHILTYGMEGLEGLRTPTADALEVRMAYYGNLTCSAPGWNCVVTLSG